MAVRLKDRIEANIRQSDKVNSSLSIQLNSGTATVYNGSAAKSINVTPAAIGAPTTGGTGATGTWGISISGNAATATTCTGNAATATALTSSAGSTSRPIYFSSGKPAQITLTLPAAAITTGFDTAFRTSINGSTSISPFLGVVRTDTASVTYAPQYGSGIVWGRGDTHGYLSVSYNGGTAYLGGGSADKLNWCKKVAFTDSNVASADKLKTARTISLTGSVTGSGSFDGSGNLSITTTTNHSHSYLPLSGGTLTGLLTISTNNRYVMLGCQNSSFAHYSTDATNGHWFNKDVAVQGDIYCGSSYNTKVLTVNGGDITSGFTKPHKGMSWIGVSHGQGAIARITTAPTDGSASCCWAVKTLNGSWGCGNLSNTDHLYFVYGTTANFNSGTNTANTSVYLTSSGILYGAAWNDYAEFRTTTYAKAGEVVIENGDGTMHRSYKRLEPAANIVSDTYGFAIGETEKCCTPIAVAGRVLAYPYEDRYSYKAGDAVCSAPDGKISKMTREEMVMYPNCIIGYVSEIPEYEVWGQTDVPVNGRIWIKIV